MSGEARYFPATGPECGPRDLRTRRLLALTPLIALALGASAALLSPGLAGTLLPILLVLPAVPPVIGIRGATHVRITSDSIEIVWCYGYLNRRERIPRHLVDRVDVLERGGRALVRLLIRGHGCVYAPVGDPDGLLEALGR